MRRFPAVAAALLGILACAPCHAGAPNIVFVLADDMGYGDVQALNPDSAIPTPNLNRLAAEGMTFTDAHTPSAVCTPTRYGLVTGRYCWRSRLKSGVLNGYGTPLIEPDRPTVASFLAGQGFTTGVVGKWHLGLGDGSLDWNGPIKPGPAELGFDYCFLIPATGDRTPCVYVENRGVVGLDPADPIQVSYGKPIGDDPTGRDHPELLKMHPSHGHDMTIVNGISRIGYMTGGKAARWVDEDMADTITQKATAFIERHRSQPFFLYFSTHDVHVPRVPHPRFVGKTDMGPRGDVIVQLDWCVGEVVKKLEQCGLADNTLVIFASDNGPVVDDGYRDQAVERLGDHRPAGPWRGGKYSNFEGGTRVPLIVRWPKRVKPGESEALVSQVDFPASLAALVGRPLPPDAAPDSFNVLPALLGNSPDGRDHLVEQAGMLSLREGPWKLIPPSKRPKMNKNTNTELGNDPRPQLYHAKDDPGETRNVAEKHPEKVKQLAARLEEIRRQGRTRP